MMNIRKVIKSEEFVYSMNDLELLVCTSFDDVVKYFLGNIWVENY